MSDMDDNFFRRSHFLCMGASCSAIRPSSSSQVSPPPRTKRQLTAYVSGSFDDEPLPIGRARSESLKEEDLKKHVAALSSVDSPTPSKPLLRQDSSRRVRFPKQQTELTRVFEYVPDSLIDR